AFATARLRDRLHGRPTAYQPRWRPRPPRRSDPTTAAIWSALARRPRAHPYLLFVWPVVVLASAAAAMAWGVVGPVAWWPVLGLAWAASQLAPGRVPWPAWPAPPRALMLAHVLPVALLSGLALLLAMVFWPYLPGFDLSAGLAAVGAAAASG